VTLDLPRDEWVFVTLVVLTGLALALALALAGYAFVLRRAHARDARRRREQEARWEPPLLDALADRTGLEALRARVSDDEIGAFLAYLLRFGRRVRGEEMKVLRELADPHLEEVVLPRLRSGETEERVRAVRTLGVLGLPRFRREVASALRDRSPLVTAVAARALADPAYDEHTSEILENLESLEAWNRGLLADLLASIGPGAAPALRWTLADRSAHPWIRAVAARALGSLPDPEAADLAAEVLRSSDERELCIECIRLLRAVGRGEHHPLVRELATSEDFVLRSQAIGALEALGDEEDLPLLVGALEDDSPWVVIHASRALRAIGGEDVLARVATAGGPGSEVARQLVEAGDDPDG